MLQVFRLPMPSLSRTTWLSSSFVPIYRSAPPSDLLASLPSPSSPVLVLQLGAGADANLQTYGNPVGNYTWVWPPSAGSAGIRLASAMTAGDCMMHAVG